MGIDEFCDVITKEIALRVKEDAKVKLEHVEKNNGVCLTGLFISRGNASVQPAIYLNRFYEDYINGRDKQDILDEIIKIYENMDEDSEIDMNFFREYNNVRDRICFKVIHYERNKNMLSKIPYLPYLDLAIVFYYAFSNEKFGDGSILIRNSHMRLWGICLEDLYKDAAENTEKVQQVELQNMGDIIKEMCGDNFYEPQEQIPMYVLSNHQKQFGAAMMLYKKVLKNLADRINKNLFILPSSVHEVILLPDCGEKPEDLRAMVREVNETQVAVEEVLSDSVYYFDRAEGEISMCE